MRNFTKGVDSEDFKEIIYFFGTSEDLLLRELPLIYRWGTDRRSRIHEGLYKLSWLLNLKY